MSPSSGHVEAADIRGPRLVLQYLCNSVDAFFLKQPLVEPLCLIGGHVGFISGKKANLASVCSLVMGQRAAARKNNGHRVLGYWTLHTSDLKLDVTSCRVDCDQWDSHAYALLFLGDLPQGEKKGDVLALVQEQRLRGGLGFQESLQSQDGPLHLANVKVHTSGLSRVFIQLFCRGVNFYPCHLLPTTPGASFTGK